MNESEQGLPLDLPETDQKKVKPKVNYMQEILAELMAERKITDAQVVKATGIPWPTWDCWVKCRVGAQMADKNLLNVARFFNVSIEYLCFGIGSDEPTRVDFEEPLQ